MTAEIKGKPRLNTFSSSRNSVCFSLMTETIKIKKILKRLVLLAAIFMSPCMANAAKTSTFDAKIAFYCVAHSASAATLAKTAHDSGRPVESVINEAYGKKTPPSTMDVKLAVLAEGAIDVFHDIPALSDFLTGACYQASLATSQE